MTSSPARCTRAGKVVSQSTGAVYDLHCKSWRCPVCGPRKADEWARLAAIGKPERFVTLTRVGSTPAELYARLKVLVKAIRREGWVIEYLAAVEVKRAGAHLHMLQKGDYLPQRWLSAEWEKIGGGRVVDIRAIGDRAGAARYIFKYALKQGEYWPGRKVRYSKGYFPKPTRELRAEMWPNKDEGPFLRRMA